MRTRCVLFIILTLGFGPQLAWAQFWGTGFYGGLQSCGNSMMGMNMMGGMNNMGMMGAMGGMGGSPLGGGWQASAEQEELQQAQRELQEVKSEMSRAKSKVSALRAAVSSQRDLLKLTGFDGETLSFLESHVTTSASCRSYQDTSNIPFAHAEWRRSCGPADGQVRESLCGQGTPRPQSFNAESCRRYLRGWIEKQKELKEHEVKVAELNARVKEADANVKAKRVEAREAQRERQQSRGGTEAGCIECQMAGNRPGGGGFQNQSGLAMAASNLALGLGSMYLNNQLQRYQTDQNARLGFATPVVQNYGYGMPQYGGMGSFACGGQMMGGYGMMNQYGMGSAFGYPFGTSGLLLPRN